MRHPCERDRQRELKTIILSAVREALHAPAHPDSKRQVRRRTRDLSRYSARIMKEFGCVSCPPTRTHKRREFRDMQTRLQNEGKEQAHTIARRLQGLTPFRFSTPVPVDALVLMAQIQQVANYATGGGMYAA